MPNPTLERGETVAIGPLKLEGYLHAPAAAHAIVVFVHGSGSSRFSPRNQYVAERLVQRGFATLLFDLLTEEEARLRANVFDIPLLADHLVMASEWLRRQPKLQHLALGYFGASTGAAAAFVAAADPSCGVKAIVSRGGRPDLAGDALARVMAPTLLIVGGHDLEVLELNEDAYLHLAGPKRLAVVPGATHLFEEPGTLDQVVDLATAWFERYLVEQDE